jgi:hypothetical protein
VSQHLVSRAHCCRTHVTIYTNAHLHCTSSKGLSPFSLSEKNAENVKFSPYFQRFAFDFDKLIRDMEHRSDYAYFSKDLQVFESLFYFLVCHNVILQNGVRSPIYMWGQHGHFLFSYVGLESRSYDRRDSWR